MFKKRYILIVFLLFSLSYLYFQIFIPLERGSEEKVLFEIRRGDSSFEISQKLAEENIIKSDLFFFTYLFLTRNNRKIQAGTYYLSPSKNFLEVTEKIVKGETASIQVTIPEGFSIEQVEGRLVEHNLIEENNLTSLKVKDFKEDFIFLKEIPSDKSLEGFLFPDTYSFSYNQDIKSIVKTMLENFNKKVFLELEEEFKENDIFEIITMASLIEKEVRSLEDKKKVSNILWRRLEISMPLQVDATIVYLTGKRTTRIPLKDLRIDSPYNTYKYSGLPIGPISNPGLESVLASLYPEDNNYWYYLSTLQGETKFSRNLGEHNYYKNIYLR